MKKTILLTLVMTVLGCLNLMGQTTIHYDLNNDIHDSIIELAANMEVSVSDDGSIDGPYNHGHDYHVTIRLRCDTLDSTAMKSASISINTHIMDIHCDDTLYVYDGDAVDPARLFWKGNNCWKNTEQETFYVTPTNPNGSITIRFRAVPRDMTTWTGSNDGFKVTMHCAKPCEKVTAVIDSLYEHTDLITGAVIDTAYMRWVPANVDTIFYFVDVHSTDSLGRDTIIRVQTDSIIRVDTVSFVWAALACQGQGLRLHGHGEYTDYIAEYQPTDDNVIFKWDLVVDSLTRIGSSGGKLAKTNKFQRADCYNVTLLLTDQRGCESNPKASVQVRVAQNPIKTIFDLDDICNNDSLLVNVGYEGEQGTLTLKKIEYTKTVTKVYQKRTFIPDGPNCGGETDKCYKAAVTFDEYNPGQEITSASDICSICINYEHTFMGDYRLAIECPIFDENVSQTRGRAVLKYGKFCTGSDCDPLATAESPDGSGAGGGMNSGIPIRSWDGTGPNTCDSLYNPFGKGWNYCWSRNGNYQLVTGHWADDGADQQGMYISSGPTVTPAVDDRPVVPGYFISHPGEHSTEALTQTRDSSDHNGKLNYYRPASDFSDLIGCPLNGEWKAVVCDFWGADNGWVFNWSMDICGASHNEGCDYQVGIDSVVWHPDTNRILHPEDFRDNKYKGLIINGKAFDPTSAYISSPDTAGLFRIRLSIYDEYGCRWDTLTKITSYYTPLPNLGNDTTLCGVNSTVLDATDRYINRPNTNYRYMWEPYGQTTPTIVTETNTGHDTRYVVQVVNDMDNKKCAARDTIIVAVRPQPKPNFDPGFYPLEGCEPLTINFTNTTTDGHLYRWDFGDGTYSTLKNPSHTYGSGIYDLKYYVESDGGCKDSLIYHDLITVFPQAKASFSWEPTFPTVLHPTITLNNTTAPDEGFNKYFWEIQYDKNNPYSVETFTDRNPSYTWTADDGRDISGAYTVRLITRADNHGPSGVLTSCGDTVENTILIINDNLKFPNIVTPNGDGINDRFVIGNLVEGLAYPINQLEIFDKWGSRVFHADNISKEEDFWDPARNNIPAGTYFYKFSGKGYQGNIEHNGVIEVVK